MDSGNFDRLPESLLVSEILSRLELREAVATCVLSKQWRFMWTKLARVELKEKTPAENKAADFVNRMIAVDEFPFVRRLSLCKVRISQEKLEKLVSRSPVLESLELNMCRGLYCVVVGNPSVRRLSVETHINEWKLDSISAPYVRELVVYGTPMRVLHASNLDRATIGIYGTRAGLKNQALLLLHDIRHVNNLYIRGCTTFLITRMARWCPGFQVIKQLLRLQNLAICTLNHCWDIYGIIALLRSSPNIHTLIIDSTSLRSMYGNLTIENLAEEYRSSEGTLDCDELLHLKFVDIAFLDTWKVQLAQIIIKKAPSLEEMVFRSRAPGLLYYPRSSHKPKIRILH